MRDGRTWREWVLSFKHRRCNETNQYHPAQQSPNENDWFPGNENIHGRTSGDEEPLTITTIILRSSQHFVDILPFPTGLLPLPVLVAVRENLTL